MEKWYENALHTRQYGARTAVICSHALRICRLLCLSKCRPKVCGLFKPQTEMIQIEPKWFKNMPTLDRLKSEKRKPICSIYYVPKNIISRNILSISVERVFMNIKPGKCGGLIVGLSKKRSGTLRGGSGLTTEQSIKAWNKCRVMKEALEENVQNQKTHLFR